MTYGGYSTQIVVDEHFVLRVPAVARSRCRGAAAVRRHHHLLAAAPLECRPGKKVGIVGLGGLGHMGVKLAHAMGAQTVLFTTSPGKAADARRLGADDVVISKDADQMATHAGSFDFILNTVAAPHDLDAFIVLLKRDATMCLVGAPATPHPSPPSST